MSPRCRTYACATVEGASDRQERIPGFDQRALAAARVLCAGAGGLGGEACEALVRIGVGDLVVCDGDFVSVDNLNRQLVRPSQVGWNKAVALARNLSSMGALGTRITAVPLFLQDALEFGHAPRDPALVLCMVDNDGSREHATREFGNRVPLIHAGLDVRAEHGTVFVHEVGGACYGCANPHVAYATAPAAAVCAASCKDLLKLAAGWTTYAAVSLLTGRRRTWNEQSFVLAAGVTTYRADRRPDCPWCGGGR